MHKLLNRQIKKYFGDAAKAPKELQQLFQAVSDAYDGFDQDRVLSERSLDLSSNELGTLNSQIRDELTKNKGIIKRLKQVAFQLDEEVSEKVKATGAEDAEYLIDVLTTLIEKRKYAEREVHNERDRLSTVLYSIGDGVVVLDNKRNITLFNSVAEKISGYSSTAVIGKQYSTFLKFVDEVSKKSNNEFIERAINEGVVTEMPYGTMLAKDDGSLVPVADSAAPIKDPETGAVVGCVIVFRDVTKEQEIESMKIEFVTLASHQLRTPLTAIKWYTELLAQEKSGALTKEQKEFVSIIHSTNENLVGLVNDLLNVSRIEAGHEFDLAPKLYDIVKLLKEVFAQQQVVSASKEIAVRYGEHVPEHAHIEIDVLKFREAVVDICSNAFKFSPQHGEIFVDFVPSKDSGMVTFSITDNGMGIPKEQHDQLFEKFFRADNVLTAQIPGTGLGLYIVKAIIERHNGKIWFTSEKGKGTTFFVSLPTKQPEEEKMHVIEHTEV